MKIYRGLSEVEKEGSIKLNSLINGDCLEIMPHIEDSSVDLILCDLPYGSTKCSWDIIIDLDELWRHYNRIIKPNGAILLFAQTPFDKVLGMSNIKNLKYEWIWEKTQATGHLNAKKMPMKSHENILVFYKKMPTYNPIKTYGHVRKVSSAQSRKKSLEKRTERYGEDYIYGKENINETYDSTERYPRSVLKFKSDKQKVSLHPTQKPLDLCEYFIRTYTNEGDVVLDNCAGSFTTILGAMNTNRKFIGIEMDSKYFEIGIKRLENEFK